MTFKSDNKDYSTKRTVALPLTLLLMAAWCVSGCTSLVFPKTAAPRYTLAPVSALSFEKGGANGSKEAVSTRLIIEDPNIEAALNSTGVAISDAPLRYKYLKDVKWSDRAPRLFGLFLRRSFQNSSLFTAVGDRTTVPIADYILYSDLRSFNVKEDKRGLSADIVLYVRLTTIDNVSLGSQLISATREIDGTANKQAVVAFDAAANEVGEQAINWAYELIDVLPEE